MRLGSSKATPNRRIVRPIIAAWARLFSGHPLASYLSCRSRLRRSVGVPGTFWQGKTLFSLWNDSAWIELAMSFQEVVPELWPAPWLRGYAASVQRTE